MDKMNTCDEAETETKISADTRELFDERTEMEQSADTETIFDYSDMGAVTEINTFGEAETETKISTVISESVDDATHMGMLAKTNRLDGNSDMETTTETNTYDEDETETVHGITNMENTGATETEYGFSEMQKAFDVNAAPEKASTSCSAEPKSIEIASHGMFGKIPYVKTGRRSRMSLTKPAHFSIEARALSLCDRRKARSLEGITSEDLFVTPAQYLQQLNLAWQFCRMCPTKLVEIELEACPGWSTFFTKISPVTSATNIGYGTLIPSSPTNPSVVHTGLQYIARMTRKMGLKHSVVTADQAIYDIAYALRDGAKPGDPTYEHLILVLGSFHLAGNFLCAVGKIMRNSGAEDILTKSGICKEGTANKILTSSGNYYQSVRAHKLLSEVMTQLHIEAFEEWYLNTNPDQTFTCHLSSDIERLLDNVSSGSKTPSVIQPETEVFDDILSADSALRTLQEHIEQFDVMAGKSPTFKYWRNYTRMIDIFLRFTAAQRNGLWEQHMAEAGHMLPYIIAAGHHNYSYSLPLYLREMTTLKTTAPEVYDQFRKGRFTVRRKDGSFNGVATDMALEQTYNRDVKESSSGLTGITLDEKARKKWLYTKPVTAATSCQLKEMLSMIPGQATSLHHA